MGVDRSGKAVVDRIAKRGISIGMGAARNHAAHEDRYPGKGNCICEIQSGRASGQEES